MTPDALDQEHLALLAAIGRALGTMQSPPAGPSLEVLGGAVSPEPERVAWIEEQSDARTDMRWAVRRGRAGGLGRHTLLAP